MILFGVSLHVCSLFLSDSMSSLSNGASDSSPKQGGILVVLLVPVSAATPVSCSLPGTIRKMKPAKQKYCLLLSKGK